METKLNFSKNPLVKNLCHITSIYLYVLRKTFVSKLLLSKSCKDKSLSYESGMFLSKRSQT